VVIVLFTQDTWLPDSAVTDDPPLLVMVELFIDISPPLSAYTALATLPFTIAESADIEPPD